MNEEKSWQVLNKKIVPRLRMPVPRLGIDVRNLGTYIRKLRRKFYNKLFL